MCFTLTKFTPGASIPVRAATVEPAPSVYTSASVYARICSTVILCYKKNVIVLFWGLIEFSHTNNSFFYKEKVIYINANKISAFTYQQFPF